MEGTQDPDMLARCNCASVEPPIPKSTVDDTSDCVTRKVLIPLKPQDPLWGATEKAFAYRAVL